MLSTNTRLQVAQAFGQRLPGPEHGLGQERLQFLLQRAAVASGLGLKLSDDPGIEIADTDSPMHSSFGCDYLLPECHNPERSSREGFGHTAGQISTSRRLVRLGTVSVTCFIRSIPDDASLSHRCDDTPLTGALKLAPSLATNQRSAGNRIMRHEAQLKPVTLSATDFFRHLLETQLPELRGSRRYCR